MLVLSRKSGQTIVLPELGVALTVLDLRGDRVRIGVSAPSAVKVHREEVWRRIQLATQEQTMEKSCPKT